MYQKVKLWRSKKYRAWVRTLPCYLCEHGYQTATSGEGVVAHHLIGIGNMGGGSTKAPDYTCMPLCRDHHIALHNDSVLWRLQWEIIVKTLGQAIDQEILTIGDIKC